MTGEEVFTAALYLAGYTNGAGVPPESPRLAPRALAAVNDVYADLYFLLGGKEFAPLASLDGAVLLPERECRLVMPFGVAAALAQSEGDTALFSRFDSEYRVHRARVPGNCLTADVMP